MGYCGQGKQVSAQMVSGTLTAIGQVICQATSINPIKVAGSDKFMLFLSQMLDGFYKANPLTLKLLPVESDVPEFIAGLGQLPGASTNTHTIGDLSLMAFYKCDE